MFPPPSHLAPPASSATGSSTPSGVLLDPGTADVTDGSDVTFSKDGTSIQAITAAMSGSASTKPSTLQAALFWNSAIAAQDILALVAQIIPTTTIEETSAITAPVIVVVGWVAVPDGATPSLANLATHKARWFAIRINGPQIQVDAGQDDSNFGWSGNLNLDVTDPTDYTWVMKTTAELYRTLEPQALFTNAVGYVSYAGTNGAHTLEHIISEGANDDVNDDDTIHTFVGIGRQATGGVSRTVAVAVNNLVAQKAT